MLDQPFLVTLLKSAIDFHAHLNLDFPLAKFFATAVSIGRAKLELNKRQYAYCDEIAVGVAIDPEGVIKTEKMLRASVELHGQLTRSLWMHCFYFQFLEAKWPLIGLAKSGKRTTITQMFVNSERQSNS